MERAKRIELLSSDWKSEVIPLYDARTILLPHHLEQEHLSVHGNLSNY
jgi:hypothetical protein